MKFGNRQEHREVYKFWAQEARRCVSVCRSDFGVAYVGRDQIVKCAFLLGKFDYKSPIIDSHKLAHPCAVRTPALAGTDSRVSSSIASICSAMKASPSSGRIATPSR